MKLAGQVKDVSVDDTLAKIEVMEACSEGIAEAQATIADGINDINARLNQMEAFKDACRAYGWGKA